MTLRGGHWTVAPGFHFCYVEGNTRIMEAQGRHQPGLESGREGVKGIQGEGTACAKAQGQEEPVVLSVLDPKGNGACVQDPGRSGTHSHHEKISILLTSHLSQACLHFECL